jgi:hypothetical protein
LAAERAADGDAHPSRAAETGPGVGEGRRTQRHREDDEVRSPHRDDDEALSPVDDGRVESPTDDGRELLEEINRRLLEHTPE